MIMIIRCFLDMNSNITYLLLWKCLLLHSNETMYIRYLETRGIEDIAESYFEISYLFAINIFITH